MKILNFSLICLLFSCQSEFLTDCEEQVLNKLHPNSSKLTEIILIVSPDGLGLEEAEMQTHQLKNTRQLLIIIKPGHYFLSKALKFTPEDSGWANFSMTYCVENPSTTTFI